MKKIAVLAAMDTEAAQIIENLEDKTVHAHGGYEYYKGSYQGKDLIVTVCSIGKVSSSVSTQIMVDYFSPDFIINTGIAGGLDDRLDVLSMVVGEEAVFHDFDHKIMEEYFPYTSVFKSDEDALYLAYEIGKDLGLDMHIGRIATGDLFVEDDLTKTRIKEDHQALCCEMEGAAISQVAYTNKIPSLIIRCISDMAGDGEKMTYYEFKRRASDESARLVLELIKRL